MVLEIYDAEKEVKNMEDGTLEKLIDEVADKRAMERMSSITKEQTDEIIREIVREKLKNFKEEMLKEVEGWYETKGFKTAIVEYANRELKQHVQYWDFEPIMKDARVKADKIAREHFGLEEIVG